jgi:hypothetical protein
LAAHQIAGANVTSPAMNAFGILQARASAQLDRYRKIKGNNA